MVFRTHRAIFSRVDHDILVRNFVRPGLSRNKGWDAQEGPTEISTVKPERLALAFRSPPVCAFADMESTNIRSSLFERHSPHLRFNFD
jgi:hypothetical protein